MIDVLIQTYNEELNLPHTLQSVKGWANRVFVVDSGSTDSTTRMAEDMGAHVVYHSWEGYARQKNWALDNMPFESPWILILDADEAVSIELRDEILEVVSRKPEEIAESGFQINRVFIFFGQEIRHCGYFPSWNLRLFKRGRARYEDRSVHEHMLVDGPVGYLQNLLFHEDRRGLEHFFAKHNRYSTLEAREIFENTEPWSGWQKFLTDRVSRRRFLKSQVVPQLPVSWVMRFLYMYFLRLGFLDGVAGWKLCNFISTYEFLIQTKYQELRRMQAMGLLAPRVDRGLSEPEGELSEESEQAIPGKPANGFISNGATGVRLHEQDATRPPALGRTIHHSIPSTNVPGGVEVRSPKIASVIADAAKALSAVVRSAGHVVGSSSGKAPLRAGKVKVSVMIPTLNEESNMPRCLDHLQWASEVVVVDSGSSDKTVEISHAYGAKVVKFDWNGQWPKKKNWALQNIDFENEWVLIVDADEWITPELADEIAVAINDSSRVGFYVNRRFIFMGRWIKHCGYYPSWNLRLIKRGQGEYEQLTGVGNTGSGDNEVHEHVVPRGPVGHLDNDMLHFAFPNIHVFMEKHNRYSNWEAAVQFRGTEAGNAAIGTELARRRRLKNLSRKLPFRPTLRFLYSYIWTGGIFDGVPGYVFCRLLAIYEYLSVAKYTELKRYADDQKTARSLSKVAGYDWQAQKSDAFESSKS